MAIDITGLDVVEEVVRRSGCGIYLANADFSGAAGAITSVRRFRNPYHGTNHWIDKDSGFWRPGASSAVEYWRMAGALTNTTGAVAVDTSYSADTTFTSEDIIMLHYGIMPDDVVDALNRTLRKIYFSNEEPLSTKPTGTTIADAGFQNSGTTAYTVDATGTFSKVSTDNSENVYPGFISSGRFQAAAAGDYIRQRYAVTEGERVHAFTLSRLDSGTSVQTILYDVTGSAAIGTSLDHAQETWQWTYRCEEVPDGCKALDLRIAGEGGAEDFYANASILYRERDLRVILDTKWETEFQAPQLAYYDFRHAHSVSEGVYDAFGAQVLPVPATDYEFVSARAGANPFALQFHDTPTNPNGTHWFQYPLFIQGRRAHSDVDGPFTLALSETTSADLDLMVWGTIIELFKNPAILNRVPNAAQTLSLAKDEFEGLRPHFKHATSTKQRQVVTMRGARN